MPGSTLEGQRNRGAAIGAPASPQPPLPPGMKRHLEEVLQASAKFSEDHRDLIPTDVLESRLADILHTVGEVFQDRVMQICFLLDHHDVLRFNELLHILPRMSTRTLSSKLSLLQERGLITRIMYDETPPRVEYRLTARGKSLVNLLFPAIVHTTWASPPEDYDGA